MKSFLRNLPIGRKITVVVVATTSLALVAASLALFAYQTMSLRRSIMADLETVADVVANNSSAAVAFDDQKAAGELIGSLRAKPQVVGADLRRKDGTRLAEYGRTDDCVVPPGGAPRMVTELHDGMLHIVRPIVLDGADIGRLHVAADFATTYGALVDVYRKVLALVLLGAVCIVVPISSVLQRAISGPILQLADVARAVATHTDYGVRAVKESEDEVGQLTDTFNAMLAEIQRQDAAITQSQERFKAAVDGSSDGIWDWDLETNTLYCSERWKAIIGYDGAPDPTLHELWAANIHPDDVATVMEAAAHVAAGTTRSFEIEYRLRHRDGTHRWVLTRGAALRGTDGRVTRVAGSQTDITSRKQAEHELAELNMRLRDVSRQAGMAEVATGVLHNVGNVLNSVIVSSGLAAERLRRSKIENFGKVTAMLAAHEHDLVPFLTRDPKGKRLPEYIIGMGEHLQTERADVLRELQALQQNVEHIKEIVAVQQNYATVGGCLEMLAPRDLVEDALRLNTGRFARHGIELRTDLRTTRVVTVDRHKVLQILVNLIGNAKHAVEATDRSDKIITVSLHDDGDDGVAMTVEDNGVGIAREHLVRVFNHGFTTKTGGHGFGLHSAANAAQEMGGSLRVDSDGPGRGARFTLRLPAVARAVERPGGGTTMRPER